MDKIKKALMFTIPTSICNFRCQYCYIAQRPIHYQGKQAKMQYSPEQVAYACRPERLGGLAFMNFCGDGETLLSKDIDLYVRALVEQGHYGEIVTNCTITPMIDKILSWPAELRARTEFKCSFHYLELKKRGMLDTFVKNVHHIWDAGSSANIELTEHDELVPYIDEVKEFSMKHFGALPQVTIARDDVSGGIDYLTKLPMDEYERIWSTFDSNFWEYKKSVFGVKQTDFCYSGLWSAFIFLDSGVARTCYGGYFLENVFEHPERPFPARPTVKCVLPHCYNAHAFLTLGCIPGATPVGYGDIRNRKCTYGGGGMIGFSPDCLASSTPNLRTATNVLLPSRKSVCRQ
ncbi:MAG: radical SAM protein [Synergistaceae bacterium]|nr:radical SAM protein [Synergistaceae bacterium]